MRKFWLLFFLLSVIGRCLVAQIIPAEGSKLNYRLVGFSFPTNKNADSCKIEIAKGICKTNESFKKNIFTTVTTNINRVVVEVPFWGENYTWRIISKGKGLIATFHHFSTLTNYRVDSNRLRLRILQNAERHQDAFVLLDNGGVMYDMKGSAVWFLPDSIAKVGQINDMKVSPSGTITLLAGVQAYEINYNGEVLWKAPNTGKISGDIIENYNHEFTRRSNGRYMILGNENTCWRPPTLLNNDPVFNVDTASRKQHVFFGTVIEYDKSGNIVWSWKSSSYFLESDINYRDPFSDHTDPHARDIADTHANAFYFDEQAKELYGGYKLVNRIVRVKYPEGTVSNAYGHVYKSGVFLGENLFCGQHSIGRSKNGNLIVYDNHTCDVDANSRVIMLQEPQLPDSTAKIVWEYPCTFEDSKINQNLKGGDVMELTDTSLFVCMGVPYSKLFIVTLDKHILWSALPEIWKGEDNRWEINSQYRANIIENSSEIEKLIWNVEKPGFTGLRTGKK